jgi:hypothetical protein
LENKLDTALNEIKVLQTALVDERNKIKVQNVVEAKKEDILCSKLTVKTDTKLENKTQTKDSQSPVWNDIIKKLRQFNGI